ncbi:E3 ubiquitin-protein ligase RFWD3 [Chionoecetes opilio]|uniref:RING-type E3 ubiquitin transferase n=1 Tax=Chionoecetes opilio TaxID=41210 RepID=A0A8J5CSB1_CHIOP|nr:E3 ubiquitin-protein ligase RFWD3 [Chionoecetes opilio]
MWVFLGHSTVQKGARLSLPPDPCAALPWGFTLPPLTLADPDTWAEAMEVEEEFEFTDADDVDEDFPGTQPLASTRSSDSEEGSRTPSPDVLAARLAGRIATVSPEIGRRPPAPLVTLDTEEEARGPPHPEAAAAAAAEAPPQLGEDPPPSPTPTPPVLPVTIQHLQQSLQQIQQQLNQHLQQPSERLRQPSESLQEPSEGLRQFILDLHRRNSQQPSESIQQSLQQLQDLQQPSQHLQQLQDLQQPLQQSLQQLQDLQQRSQHLQQPSQPIASDQPQASSSVSPPDNGNPPNSASPPESASHPVEASASSPPDNGSPLESASPPEEASLPAVAGPSTSSVSSGAPPKGKPPDAERKPAPEESDDEGQICPICFDPWANMGEHRLVSLKCGHLFGLSCITQWLQGANRHKGRCPQCNFKATRKDIRIIYAKSIKVLDTTEKERIMQELENERELKRRLEVRHAQKKFKYEQKKRLVIQLQEQLNALKASALGAGQPGLACSQGEGAGSGNSKLVYKEWVEVCREGGCRVMAHSEWLGMLVVSMPSQVGMFPGYGIKKVNLLELHTGQYVPLHQKQIRDLAFSPTKHDLLLSVAMDKVVKITNVCSNAPVVNFLAPAPLWCCCWSTTESNMFYVGTASGRLLQYDTRNTNTHVATIELPGSGPVVSMAYVHPGPDSSLTWGGLLAARLQCCFFVEVGKPGEAKSHVLPLEGTFTSVACEADNSHVLVSCRPTQRHPHARHVICYLQPVNVAAEEGGEGGRTVSAQPVHTFQGGTAQKVLSRTLLARAPHPNAGLLVYASDESTQSIYVWELGTMRCLQQLRCTRAWQGHSDTVVDLKQLIIGDALHLAALTEKGVRLYCWADHK